MFPGDYTAQIAAIQRHNGYLNDADAYRTIARAGAPHPIAHPSPVRMRLIERVGAWMIALGRRLCERRGTVAVEVAFHTGPAARIQSGEHVA